VHEHALVTVLIVAVCTALYAWTVGFPMVFDDDFYLQTNPLFRDWRSLGYITWFTEFANRAEKLGVNPDLATNMILRPVAYATFRLHYALDGFRPDGYRLFNIVIHTANAVLLYGFLRVLFRQVAVGAGTLSESSRRFIAITAALLFAAHPMATESVTYIIQRFTSLSTFFYLLTLLLYLRAGEVYSTRQARWLTAASVVTVLLGMLTKECVFTAPVVAVLIDRLVLGREWKPAIRRALPLLAAMPLIPVLVLLTAWAQHGQLSLHHAVYVANSKGEPIAHWHYLITQLTVLCGYLRRLVWPSGLNIDPHWPLHRSVLDAAVLGSLLVCGLIIGGAAWLWKQRTDDLRMRGVFLFVLWFFVTIAVSSGLVPLPDLMAEHRTYLPSLGVFTVVALLLDWARQRLPGWMAPTVVTASVLALGVSTFQRNEVWRTPVTLWEDAVAKNPDQFRPWANLASSYGAAGRAEESARCYRKAIELNPTFMPSRMNLAVTLNHLQRFQESLDVSLATIHMKPESATWPDMLQNLGVAYYGLGRFSEAILSLEKAHALAPTQVWMPITIGMCRQSLHQPDEALRWFRKAQALLPHDPNIAEMISAQEKALQGASAAVPRK
jgi:Flp pilus assembly protein TadD